MDWLLAWNVVSSEAENPPKQTKKRKISKPAVAVASLLLVFHREAVEYKFSPA